MKPVYQIAVASFIIIVAVGIAYAFDYFWLADEVSCWFPGIDEEWTYWHGDTLSGRIHSNDALWVCGNFVFYDYVSTSADSFVHCSNYHPQYVGQPPVFNAPPVLFPERAEEIRVHAAQQGHFYSMPRMQAKLIFDGTVARFFFWRRGVPLDSTNQYLLTMQGETYLFFDCPLRVEGILQGQVFLGSSHDIRIDNDLRYTDASPLTGETPYSSTNRLVLVSEGSIKIRNTPANGRENSGGLGLHQPNRDSTDVVITASLWALGGSFTFENQNDPDSGYVCDCWPDNRGQVWLFGTVTQRETGCFYRTYNNGGTGYLLQFRWDQRWRFFDTMVEVRTWSEPEDMDFGDVPLGTTATDTLRLTSRYPGHLGAVYATYPFRADRVMPFQGTSFVVPTHFTPPGIGLFNGILYVSTSYEHFEIALRGRGVPPEGPAPLTVNVSPNPFNLSTTIHYALPAPEAVRISLYDILGREAKQMELGSQDAGEHSISLNASDLASGVYFLHFQAGSQAKIQKILLVK